MFPFDLRKGRLRVALSFYLHAVDVVYPLNKGSLWDDNELRYSLRSLEIFFPRVWNVFIIGHRPEWLKGVVHIASDNEGRSRDMRIMNKAFQACRDPRVSKTFLFMNDDHFFLKPFLQFPFLHGGSLETKLNYSKPGAYTGAIGNTVALLQELGRKQIKHFDIHCPIEYDKGKFLELLKVIEPDIKNGYIIKSLYCGYHNIEGEFSTDLKLNRPLLTDQFRREIRGRSWFSMGDGATETIGQLMRELYPMKSKWEI